MGPPLVFLFLIYDFAPEGFDLWREVELKGRRSQAGFQLTRIDEEPVTSKYLDAETKFGVAVHNVRTQASSRESLAETRLKVNRRLPTKRLSYQP
jgi:hypothetical protein